MLLAFGLFVFELGTLPFEELQRRTSWNHASNSRVGARDAFQYVGPGDDQVTLSGALLPQVAGTFASLRTLRDMADEGESWPLTAGTGQIFGNYIVKSIDETRKHMMVDGVPRKTDFTITLDRVS